MNKRIRRIAPLQLGIVLAAFYGALSLLIVPIFAIIALVEPRGQSGFPPVAGVALIVLLPILYATMGFIFGVIAAAVYNLLARWTGGIEITLVDAPEPASPLG